jgi:hypothetical protein
MVLNKLQEALAEIGTQRKALDRVENQLKSMIAELSGIPGGSSWTANFAYQPVRVADPVSSGRDRDKLDDITDILRAEGRPLHITVIAERLSKLYGKKVERTTIEPGVNRHISKVKARRIDKFGPSTFGLPEWRNSQPTLANIA